MAGLLVGLFFVHDLGPLATSQPGVKLGLPISDSTGAQLDFAGEALGLAQTPKGDKGDASQIIGGGLVTIDAVGGLLGHFIKPHEIEALGSRAKMD